MKLETLKIIEDKVGKSFEVMGTGEKFLNRTLMACALRSRINKWDLIKLQSFCKAKDTVNRAKRQPTDLEKIFNNPTSNRGLIHNIYKELKKLESIEPNNLIKNGVQIFCIHFFVEGNLGSFQLLATINIAAMNIVEHVSV